MRNNLFPMAMILLLMSSLLVFSVSASIFDSYTKIGDNSQEYDMGFGYWNGLQSIESTYLKSGSFTGMPLIYDFDNDGQNEIAAFKSNSIVIYEGKTLLLTSGYTMPTTGRAAPLYAYDIDGDGTTEIIATKDNSDSIIRILSYNGTDLYLKSSVNYSSIYYSGQNMSGNILIACREANSCLAVGTTNAVNKERMLGFGFNSTHPLQSALSYLNGDNGYVVFPYIRSMSVDAESYVFSVIKTTGISPYKMNVYKVQPYSNGTLELNYGYTFKYDYTPAVLDAGYEPYYLTSPVLYDYTSEKPGKEIAIGFQYDDEQQVLYVLDSTGAYLDRYPQLLYIDGSMVSNVIPMKARDEELTDFCLSGYDFVNSKFRLTCGNPDSSAIIDTRAYSMTSTSNPANSNTSMMWGISHKVQNYQDSIGFDEIINSKGVSRLEDDCGSCLVSCECTMSNMVTNIDVNSTMSQVDFEKSGRSDLILTSRTNIYYYDDGYDNHVPNFTYSRIEPCVNAIWKVNESVNIILTGADAEGDNIMITAWYGDEYQQSDWQVSSSSFSASFVANETGTKELGISIKDDFDNSTNTTETFSITTALTGVETDDCATTNYYTPSTASTSTNGTSVDTIPADSNLVNGLEETASMLGMSLFLLYILLMGVVALGMFIYLKEHSIGAIAIVEALMLIFGVKLGIIGYGIIIFISIIGIIVIGVWLSSRFMGNKGGG